MYNTSYVHNQCQRTLNIYTHTRCDTNLLVVPKCNYYCLSVSYSKGSISVRSNPQK